MFAAAKIALLELYSNSWYDSHFRGLSVSGVERVVFHLVVSIFPVSGEKDGVLHPKHCSTVGNAVCIFIRF